MFVAQHAGRTRLVRRAFLAACLVPAVCLAAWGAWRHAPPHRAALEQSLEAALGVDIAVARVVHLRPGVVRLEGVVVAAEGATLLTAPRVELETSATEVRLKAEGIEAAPEAVGAVTAMARAWLAEPHRFRHDVVVEAEGAWTIPVPGGDPRFSLRGECVAADNGRAVRVRSSVDRDDALVVRLLGGQGAEPSRVEIRAAAARPVAVPLLVTLVGRPGLRLGGDATVSGACTLTVVGDAVDGELSGVVDGIDLAAATRASGLGAEGTLRAEVASARIAAGRLVVAEGEIRGGPGTLDRAALDAVVGALGFRPGPAWGRLGSDRRASFDAVAARVGIDGAGLSIAAGGADGAVITAGGAALLEAPPQRVPFDRLAWAVSPGATRAVPATEASAWLLSVLPLPQATGALPASQNRR